MFQVARPPRITLRSIRATKGHHFGSSALANERNRRMSDGRAKVVIIGAGFGGLEAAKSLQRTPVEWTRIDQQNHHCFQPLLSRVAPAALSPADVAWPIR